MSNAELIRDLLATVRDVAATAGELKAASRDQSAAMRELAQVQRAHAVACSSSGPAVPAKRKAPSEDEAGRSPAAKWARADCSKDGEDDREAMQRKLLFKMEDAESLVRDAGVGAPLRGLALWAAEWLVADRRVRCTALLDNDSGAILDALYKSGVLAASLAAGDFLALDSARNFRQDGAKSERYRRARSEACAKCLEVGPLGFTSSQLDSMWRLSLEREELRRAAAAASPEREAHEAHLERQLALTMAMRERTRKAHLERQLALTMEMRERTARTA